MRLLSGLRSCLGFLTVLPVGMRFRKYEEVARAAWLFPAAGAVIAAIAGFAGLIADYFAPDTLSAGIALMVLLLLTGFHHLDGLLDTADAAMVRGTPEKRLKAMHDINHGVAAFGVGFFVLLLSYLAVYEAKGMLTALIVGEASAKFAMVVACYSAGRVSHSGMGEAFVKVLRRNHRTMLLCFMMYLPFLLLAWERAPVVLALVLIVVYALTTGAEKAFGGISGDVLGAVNEVSRLAALFALV